MSLYDINGDIIFFNDGENTVDLSLLKGKKWLALGDSATYGQCGKYTDGVTPATAGMWVDMANDLGMTLYSYAIVGSTIRYSTNGNGAGYSYQPMVTRVDDLISDHSSEADNVGLITFMGGGNDTDAEEFLGTLKSNDNTTIYGACHQIFNKLLNAFPNAKIIVILQHVLGNAEAPTEGEFFGFTGQQLSVYFAQKKQRIVKEVAEFYGLPICDCCFDFFTTTNPTHLSKYWQSDKIHLSADGRRQMNKKLIKTIESAFSY